MRTFVMSDIETKIKQQIAENPILLYMKGTPSIPMCGFSSQTVQALMECGAEFNFVNILDEPEIRATLPKIANWPTFPQLWVKGELVGGCDIICDLHQEGKLKNLLNSDV